jgi:hypothetical protein
MDNPNGAYPQGSLSHFIGKRLEEILSHRDYQMPQHAKSSQMYGVKHTGRNMMQSWEPWVSASSRDHLSRQSVRRSAFKACV